MGRLIKKIFKSGGKLILRDILPSSKMTLSYKRWLFVGINHPTKENPDHEGKIPKPGDKNPEIKKNSEARG